MTPGQTHRSAPTAPEFKPPETKCYPNRLEFSLMADNTTKLNFPRLLLGLAGALFVAAIVLGGGALIILGTRTETYLNVERSLERFVGN